MQTPTHHQRGLALSSISVPGRSAVGNAHRRHGPCPRAVCDPDSGRTALVPGADPPVATPRVRRHPSEAPRQVKSGNLTPGHPHGNPGSRSQEGGVNSFTGRRPWTWCPVRRARAVVTHRAEPSSRGTPLWGISRSWLPGTAECREAVVSLRTLDAGHPEGAENARTKGVGRWSPLLRPGSLPTGVPRSIRRAPS